MSRPRAGSPAPISSHGKARSVPHVVAAVCGRCAAQIVAMEVTGRSPLAASAVNSEPRQSASSGSRVLSGKDVDRIDQRLAVVQPEPLQPEHLVRRREPKAFRLLGGRPMRRGGQHAILYLVAVAREQGGHALQARNWSA